MQHSKLEFTYPKFLQFINGSEKIKLINLKSIFKI